MHAKFTPDNEGPLIRLSDVPKLTWLPLRRRGKRLAVSSCYRWAQRGIRGVRLETIQFGGTRCTTEAALLRFCEALSTSSPQAPAPASRTSGFERAERQLDRAGI